MSRKLDPEFRKKYVMAIKGQEFIKFRGLVLLGHEDGMQSMQEEIVQFPCKENNFTTFAKGVVIDADGKEWIGIGDANSQNCNKMIAEHASRMAGTRALGRALRHMVKVDMVMFEELSSPWEKTPITQMQLSHIKNMMTQYSLQPAQVQAIAAQEFRKSNAKDLTEEEGWTIISIMENMIKESKNPTPPPVQTPPSAPASTPEPGFDAGMDLAGDEYIPQETS